jgi:hypothetical protein
MFGIKYGSDRSSLQSNLPFINASSFVAIMYSTSLKEVGASDQRLSNLNAHSFYQSYRLTMCETGAVNIVRDAKL